mmetsp:Transcript_52302/g.79414  ORF Transcript_52302/g.79414 Transcript_52302/m.79414 type:complete len:170 (-) Transcript_52302:56-565(-)
MRPISGKDEIDALPIQSKSVTELPCSVAQFFQVWENDDAFIEATNLKLERTCCGSDHETYGKGFSRRVTTNDGFVVDETFTVFDPKAGEICFYGTKATLFGLIPVANAFAERWVLTPNDDDGGGCTLDWQVGVELNWLGRMFLTSTVQKANDAMVLDYPEKVAKVALKL